MLDTFELGSLIKEKGFDFYSGVPCSFLNPLINYASSHCDYYMASNEGDAIAACAGAYLGGRLPVVLMQNSGLGNAVSPITSLLYTFKIPVLGFVSLRGEPGISDEPQHELMGQITMSMLETMQVEWAYLSDSAEEVEKQIESAYQVIQDGRSFFFVVKKGVLKDYDLQKKEAVSSKVVRVKSDIYKLPECPTRTDALRFLSLHKTPKTIVFATTGKTGRELFEVEDSNQNFYQVGSMGCVVALAFGFAVVRPDLEVVVIDGDGAALMRLGNFPMLGHYRPANLLHVLLDNHVHDSTGGQPTVSESINFVEIAYFSGYPQSFYAHTLQEIKSCIDKWRLNKKLTFVTLEIQAGSPKGLGRPTVTPEQVKNRLMEYVNG